MPGELIGRDALERIIQRAAELQANEHDIGDGLTEGELLALGQDVGIPTRFLRQALLEEQTRRVTAPSRGWVTWVAGPLLVAAERVVPGERASVDRALDAWMQQEESLQLRRRYADHTTWEPRVGAFASIQRALGAGGRTFALARASEVAGHVTPLETGFCHVRLLADVRRPRERRLWGAAAVLGVGVAASLASPVLGVLAPWTLVPLAAALGAAVVTGRQHQRENERIAVGLEQILDRLEHGEIRPEHMIPSPRLSAFVRIAAEIRKAF